MNIDEIRAGREYVVAELRALHESTLGRELTDDEQARFDEAKAFIADADAAVTRHNEILALSDGPAVERGFEPADFQVAPQVRGADDIDYRTATPGELRDAALKLIDGKVAGADAQAAAEEKVRRSSAVARHAVKFGGEAYASAFSKMIAGREWDLTDAEKRALNVGTTTQGGSMVPTHLDPTIILSSAGTANPFRQISRQVTLAEGNQWNGITSAGVTASFDAELAEVSDDTPTIAAPSVPVHMARAFVPYSIEAEQDISSLASEAAFLLADAKDVLESSAFATGTGTNEPTGIFTALDANTNVEVANTTAATLGAVDLYAVWEALGPRARSRASWVANIAIINDVRQLGTTDPNFTVNIMASGIPELFGRPVYEASDAPSTPSSTTQVENWLVVGDFANYVIVDKVGLSVERVAHTLGSNRRPDGGRGWFAYWRVGADSVNDTAFRILQDITSA